MSAFLAVTSYSAVCPLSLADAKKHLRVDHSDDDDSIQAVIEAAFEMIERRTGRAFREQNCQLKLSEFPAGNDPLYLPKPPVLSVSSILYRDSNNVSQTLNSALYVVQTAAIPGQIIPTYGTSWPTALDNPESVIITYSAGSLICPTVVLHAAKLFCDLEYHEHATVEAERIQRRIESLIAGLVLRDRNLIGIST